MIRLTLKAMLLLSVVALFLPPSAAFAQTGTIAGQARDASGAALPGVTVEVRSPALIEKVRSTTTDGNGRYQITALPVGTCSSLISRRPLRCCSFHIQRLATTLICMAPSGGRERWM